ncbi:MAG: low specificity L-threonine aldolase [Spirochaetota bacterium]|nr:MAG: low specificity L-threonine aldolase [Spirochaetota bacterium]
MNHKRGFASDNNSGIHNKIIEAIQKANEGHCIAYGDDQFTETAVDRFKEHFGDDIDVYFLFTGTASNVLGLKALTRSFHSIICTEVSHLNVDECGAPENFLGTKLVIISSKDGKLRRSQIEPLLDVFGNEHRAQPKAISITQPTEMGTVYSIEEIKDLARLAHKNGMWFHMDGARIANAAASLGTDLKTITRDAGVDVLSLGGTKNGMMVGEAVVFFDKKISKDFKYIRKQGMQLGSKMRYLSAQFEAYLSDNLWLNNAKHANSMAKLLASELEKIAGITITQKVEANGVFAIIPQEHVKAIQKEYFFYVWIKEGPVVRLMTSWDTTEDDVIGFIKTLKKIMKN